MLNIININRRNNSLKVKLFLNLTALISVTLIITDLIAFVFTKREIQELFDANLIKSSKLILGLVRYEVINDDDDDFATNLYSLNSGIEQISYPYEYKIHFQAWNGDRLIYKSDDKVYIDKPDYEGFRDDNINNLHWRIFSLYDRKSNIHIVTMERHEVRSNLIENILAALIITIYLSLIPIILIIWNTIKSQLKPLNLISSKIKQMSADTLQPIKEPNLPNEIKPFVESLNSLLFKLRESMESERRFTDYAAHELRTPMAAIKTISQLIAKNKDKNKEEEFINDLIKSIDRATHLINQLFTLSRLESENWEFEKENIDLAETTKNLLQSYREELQKKNLTIKISAEKLSIMCNKTYIEILLRNLIDNAIKYSTDKGLITIDIFHENQQAIFKIINNGKQISQQETEKIFDKFYRITKDGEEIIGCGLGLAISKKITELHHGKIKFSSVNNENIMEVRFDLR